MKKTLSILLALSACLPLASQVKMEPWQDPNVFEENRMPMHATFVTEQQKTLSLNGLWKFNFNESVEGRTTGFEAPAYDDSSWGRMPVPGMWELNGYGDPLYLNIGYAWRGHYRNNPPYPPAEKNHVGQYRRTFSIDKSWIGTQICLCIGSATSNVRVWINGKPAGYSEDSKLEARFDITKLVRAGENTIALEVFRWCDGSYLEDQDFWRFSGIARGIYVYSRPKDQIVDVRLTAGMDGSFSTDVQVTPGIKMVQVRVLDREGRVVTGAALDYVTKFAKYKVSFVGKVEGAQPWSAEVPYLYTMEVSAFDGNSLIERTSIPFGFRTVQIRDGQLLVNGQPVLIKGADRHEISPERGYVVSEAEMLRDIRIMKELNINAVRTCHYPDDPLWLSLCDKYGLYVVDEANIESHGMGYGKESLAHRPDFKAAHLVRDQRMVMRDINHPSVIIWSMGNEAGDGENFTACYNWIKSFDPTRPVQYERAEGGANTDINCPMYATPRECERMVSGRPAKPLIQCEYAHAMGNSMGNFKEYWDLIRKYPCFQGGFIWDFADQGIRWSVDDPGTDHIIAYGGDFNEYDPSDGSFNCNGVIAADRQLHPHAYEARYQMRNILTTSSDPASGEIQVYNEHFFKSLYQYRLMWTLVADGEPFASGSVENLKVRPQETATVRLKFPELPEDASEIFLNVSYLLKSQDGILPAGTEVAYDQIVVRENRRPFVPGSAKAEGGVLSFEEKGGSFVFAGSFSYPSATCDGASGWEAVFSKESGTLASYKVNGSEMMAGPLLPQFSRAVTENDMGARLHQKMNAWRYQTFKPKSVSVAPAGDGYVIKTVYNPVADGAARVEMTYVVRPDGSIEGTESLKDEGKLSSAPDLFRFGMEFQMEGRYSTLDFYGRGPWENYCDRNSGAMVGRYIQSVDEQYHYGYVRPQESGTKTDLRYFRILNPAGTGLEISSPGLFSASALPFPINLMDCAENGTPQRANKTNVQAGEARHSLELKKHAFEGNRSKGITYVNFDLRQMGVGGNNSWGALPLEEYLIHPKEMQFSFVIRPVDGVF